MGNRKSFAILLSLILTVYYLRTVDLSPTRLLVEKYRDLAEESEEESSSTSSNEIVIEVCDDIDLDDQFSESERDRANSFRDSLASLRGGNPLLEYIEGGGSNDDLVEEYAIPLIPFAAVWIVFFAFSIIGCCVYLCNWCCMFGFCKSCCKSRCKCCKIPKGKRCFMAYYIGALIFTVAIFGAGIAGIVLSGGVAKGTRKTTCASVRVLADLIDGVPEENWLGVAGSVVSLDDMEDKAADVTNQLDPFVPDYEDLDDLYDLETAAIVTLHDDNNDLTVPRADPHETPSNYEPEYIATIGPIEDTTTQAGSIQAELDEKHIRTKASTTSISQSVDDLKSQSATMQQSISDGRDSAEEARKSLQDTLETFGNFSVDVNSASKSVNAGLMAVFIVNLVVALAALGSILLVKLCKMKFFTKVTHITWCIMSIFMIFGFILSTILYPVSIVLLEGCEVVDTLFEDKEFFNKTMYTMAMSGGSGDILYRCLHGDGDILVQFGIKEQFEIFNDIFDALEQAEGLYGDTPDELDISVVIPLQLEYVENVQTFFFTDSTESTDDIKTLNSMVNGGCTSVKDTWMLTSQNCTGSGTYTFEAADDADENRGDKTCIGFDAWIATARAGADRYTSTQIPSSCSSHDGDSQLSYVREFVDDFTDNRDAVQTIFADVLTDLQAVDSANDDYMNEVWVVTTPLNDVNDTVSVLYDAVYDSETGLAANSYCTFVKGSLERFSDAMCVGFISSIYQTSIAIIIISFFSFFGSFFVFCLAKRLNVKGKDDEDEESK